MLISLNQLSVCLTCIVLCLFQHYENLSTTSVNYFCLYSHQRASCMGLWSKQRVKFADLCFFWMWRGRVSGVVLLTHPSASSGSVVNVCVRLWHLFTSVSVRLSEWSALWDLTFKYKSLSSPLSLSLPFFDHVWQDLPQANSLSRWIWTLTAMRCLFKSLSFFFLNRCIYPQPNLSQIKCHWMMLFWLF